MVVVWHPYCYDPGYERWIQRRDSFIGYPLWQSDHRSSANVLALHGFRYSGHGYKIICDFCRVHIEWLTSYDPCPCVLHLDVMGFDCVELENQCQICANVIHTGAGALGATAGVATSESDFGATAGVATSESDLGSTAGVATSASDLGANDGVATIESDLGATAIVAANEYLGATASVAENESDLGATTNVAANESNLGATASDVVLDSAKNTKTKLKSKVINPEMLADSEDPVTQISTHSMDEEVTLPQQDQDLPEPVREMHD